MLCSNSRIAPALRVPNAGEMSAARSATLRSNCRQQAREEFSAKHQVGIDPGQIKIRGSGEAILKNEINQIWRRELTYRSRRMKSRILTTPSLHSFC